MLPRRLRARMARAHDLDDIAHKLLAAMEVDLARVFTAAEVAAERATEVTRSTLVLRDGLSARAVVMHPEPDDRHESDSLISRSAWTWLQARLAPCLIDPAVGTVRAVSAQVEPVAPESEIAVSEATGRFLDAQQGTHLLVLPLLDPQSVLRGAVSISLRNLACVRTGFVCLADWSQAWTDRLTDASVLLAQHRPVAMEAVDADALLPVIGESTRALLTTLHRVARSRTTVLLQGEPGVGKSRLARWVHAMSTRRDGPFVAAHLHTFTEELLPGALFGWKQGAHSGATVDHPGLLGEAQGGTLFLDEVDRMPLSTQDRLLELLESRIYRPLSGTEQRADVRILVGTNQDLEALASSGAFRRDLLDRIADVAIVLPPLRERRDEIAAWARFMALDAARDDGFAGRVRWTPQALSRLEAQPWPRNLRGLHRCVRRAWMLAADAPSARDTVELTAPIIDQALALGFVGRRPAVAPPPDPSTAPALGSDRSASPPLDLQASLEACAQAWLAESRTRPAPLPFDWGEAFGAAVVHAAIAAAGNRADGLRSLGLDRWVTGGNSKKVTDRATRAWTAFLESLGTEGGQPYSDDDP